MDGEGIVADSTPVEASAEVAAVETPVTSEVVTETPAETSEAPAEKMIPQSQVNRIAAKEARAAAEKARRDVMAELQAQQQSQQTQQPASDQIVNMTQDQLKEHIKRAAHEMSIQSVAEKMAQDFEAKIEAKIDADPEFEKKYKALQIERHPELILWSNGLDNTADVIADIADHPTKMANILMLAKSGLQHLAQAEFTKLSASIKANQAAQKQPVANAPLTKVNASNIGSVDDSQLSVTDMRKIFRG